MEDQAVTKFREYLRIKSVHPNPDYGKPEIINLCSWSLAYLSHNFGDCVLESCAKFLQGEAASLGLEFHRVNFGTPTALLFAVCMTWLGKNPALKSIMLNSHMDVVPADYVNILLSF